VLRFITPASRRGQSRVTREVERPGLAALPAAAARVPSPAVAAPQRPLAAAAAMAAAAGFTATPASASRAAFSAAGFLKTNIDDTARTMRTAVESDTGPLDFFRIVTGGARALAFLFDELLPPPKQPQSITLSGAAPGCLDSFDSGFGGMARAAGKGAQRPARRGDTTSAAQDSNGTRRIEDLRAPGDNRPRRPSSGESGRGTGANRAGKCARFACSFFAHSIFVSIRTSTSGLF